jgi:hypothetical protein
MALPLATTTFTIHRQVVLSSTPAVIRDPDGEGYGTSTDGPGPTDPAAFTVIETGIRGAVGSPGGSERDSGGSVESVTWSINLDPCDITHNDEITDEQTGVRYRVEWIIPRKGLSLDHMKGSVRTVKGAAP